MLALKGKRSAKIQAYSWKQRYRIQIILVKIFSFYKCHVLSGHSWTVAVQHSLGWVMPRERNSPFIFLPWKMENSCFPCPTRMGKGWKGMTQEFCVCGREPAAALPPTLLFCKAEGEAGSTGRGERMMSTAGHSTLFFPAGTRCPARSRHSFPCHSSCASGSCSLKKDTYPCFLFS